MSDKQLDKPLASGSCPLQVHIGPEGEAAACCSRNETTDPSGVHRSTTTLVQQINDDLDGSFGGDPGQHESGIEPPTESVRPPASPQVHADSEMSADLTMTKTRVLSHAASCAGADYSSAVRLPYEVAESSDGRALKVGGGGEAGTIGKSEAVEYKSERIIGHNSKGDLPVPSYGPVSVGGIEAGDGRAGAGQVPMPSYGPVSVGGNEAGDGRASAGHAVMSPLLDARTKKTADDSNDEAPSPKGRQPAFEAAKRTLALWPHEQQDRKQRLDRIGVLFRQDVRKALEGFPEMELKWRHGDRSLDPVGFTDGDKAKIEKALGLTFIDAGGMAGGIKAVHEGLGLFLKFAFDHLGFYGSTRMAAKAAKREAAASRWVHAMDSVHVSTPLLECVDVCAGLVGGGHYSIRVQAFARVDVRGCMAWDEAAFRKSHESQHGGQEPDAGAFETAFATSVRDTTLRVGSSDGGTSMHQDEEQLEDVVKPLARHFGIAEYVARGFKAVQHKYIASDTGGTSTSTSTTFLDVLQERGMDPDCVKRVRGALDHGCMRLTAEDEKRLTPQEQELARAVFAAIESSGARLDYRKPVPNVEHVCEQLGDVEVNMHLPFDVEVHQLPSGYRMILDTHRLLMPDVPWMDWMRSDEAKPRVWAIDTRTAGLEPGGMPILHRGQLDSFCMSGRPQSVSIELVRAALQKWCDSTGVMAGVTFKSGGMQRHVDSGCISACAKDSSGKVIMVAIVACPRWYYSGNAAMTCLLPPEAAHRLRELEGDDAFEGLSPDLIMRGDARARSRARQCIGKLYAKASAEVLALYRTVDVYADPAVHRVVLKRLMHSFGLGLRHVRLLVDQLEDEGERGLVGAALLHGQVNGNHSIFGTIDGRRLDLSDETAKRSIDWYLPAQLFASTGVDTTVDLAQATTRPSIGMQSVVHTSCANCAGTSLAAAGGIHRMDAIEGAISLVQELAHTYRVEGSDQAGVLDALSNLSAKSSGLEHTRRAAATCIADLMAKPGVSRDTLRLATTLHDIASCLVIDRQDAMVLYEQCRQIREIALGKMHPDYARTLSNMASCLQSQGKYAEALKLYEQCRQIREIALGKMHPNYARTLNNIASCLQSQGKYAEALKLHEQCRQIREIALGKLHPNYATTLNNIALCLQSQGKYAEALKLYEQCRQIRETALGKDHPDYATTLNNMASCLVPQGKYAEALKLYEQCMQIMETALGKDHPDYATTLNNMASCLDSQGKYAESLVLLEQCRKIYETTLGKMHPEYASTLNNMASCLQSQGKYPKALEILEQCKQIMETALGKLHPNYATVLNSMALCLKSQGKHVEAMDLLEQCRYIYETTLGKMHPEYARTLNSMVSCLHLQGKFLEAMNLLEQCRYILETALGKKPPEYARTLNSMAVGMRSQGKCLEAMSLLEQCRYILETALSKLHPAYLQVLKRMRTMITHSSFTDKVKTLSHLVEALTLQKGKQSQEYRATVQELVALLLDAGRTAEAHRYMDGMAGATLGGASPDPGC